MIDDTDLAERLRRDLAAHRDGLDAPPGLLTAARARSRRRRARTAALAAAALVVVAGAVGVATAGRGDQATTVIAGPGEGEVDADRPGPLLPAPSTSSTTFPTGPPSQAPEAAARDLVPPTVAELPYDARVEELARVEDGMETWIVSQPADVAWEMADDDDGNFGDREGVYGIDFVNVAEYAEVLLLGSGVPIVRAYPMPSIVPSWIHVTGDAVYAGRLGDGALPQSSLVRIDRSTLEAEVVVFPSLLDGEPLDIPRPGWRDATPEEAERYSDLITYGPDAVGTLVTTAWGPGGRIGVDIAGVEALFAGG